MHADLALLHVGLIRSGGAHVLCRLSPAGIIQEKSWQAISLALSQKSAGTKGDNCGGPCKNGEEGHSVSSQVHWTGHFFGCANARGGGRRSRVPSSATR